MGIVIKSRGRLEKQDLLRGLNVFWRGRILGKGLR